MGPRPARHEHRSRCEVDAGSRNPEELFLRLCFGRAVFCCLRSTERSIQQSAPTPVLERGRFACEVLQPEGCMRNRRLGHISQSDPAQSVRRCKAGRHRFVKGGKRGSVLCVFAGQAGERASDHQGHAAEGQTDGGQPVHAGLRQGMCVLHSGQTAASG